VKVLVQFLSQGVFLFGIPEMCITENKIKNSIVGFKALAALIIKSSVL
jgi:hypothetical protein